MSTSAYKQKLCKSFITVVPLHHRAAHTAKRKLKLAMSTSTFVLDLAGSKNGNVRFLKANLPTNVTVLPDGVDSIYKH
jgi:hypothetical protein